MNKQVIIQNLKETSKELAQLTETIDKQPLMKTEGSLVTRHIQGKTRMYQRRTGSNDKYLGADDRKLTILLAQKAYAQRLSKAAMREKEQLDSCVEVLESGIDKSGMDSADIDLVYGRLPDHIRANTGPSQVTDDGFAERWQKEEYQNRWMKSNFSYETPRGEKVRSKSEWMIACMLAEAGVPYRYEEIVPLNAMFGVFLHPDFTVLNKRTRKVYYWEHFGRMSDPEYIENSFMPKMNDYYNFDFLPGDKLLMTFESKGHPLDTTSVKRLIERFLL